MLRRNILIIFAIILLGAIGSSIYYYIQYKKISADTLSVNLDNSSQNAANNTWSIITAKGVAPLNLSLSGNDLLGSISDATANSKGVASFSAQDFNISSGAISINYNNSQVAAGSTKGLLVASDWLNFNNKQSALSFGDLTVGSTKITIGGTGAGAVIGTGLSIDINEGNINHNNLLGLNVGDPHTQYAYLNGRSGGQSLSGGADANDDITIQGTTNATKTTSYVVLQPSGGNVGIGTTAPSAALEVSSASVPTLRINSTGLYSNGRAALTLDRGTYGGATQYGWQFLKDQFDLFEFRTIVAGIATSRMILDTNGSMALGVATPTLASYILSLGGTTARTIGMERNINSASVGNNLTLIAGGATVPGALATVSVTAGGSGYVMGDILTLTTGNNNAKVVVATVDGSGAVLTVAIFVNGSGYSTGAGQATTGGTGTGCTINVTSVKTSTDKNGGGLILSGGISTGTGTSTISLQTATAGLSGTTDNAPTTKMTILGNGNVGIGTTAPVSQLNVQGTNTAGVITLSNSKLIVVAGDSMGQLDFYTNDASAITNRVVASIKSIAETDYVGTDNAPTSLAFWTHSAPGAATEKMRILGNGNVGIGITAPTANLQVTQGATGAGTVITNGTTSVIGVGTQFLNTFKVGDTITVSGETRTIATIISNFSLTTDTWTGSFAGFTYTLVGGTRFSVLGNGNVGIGLTGPTATLHIKAGTATLNTAPLKFNSGILLTTPEAGAIEFLTDTFYMTATNGVAGSTQRQAIPGVTTGTAAPATTPIRVGDIYVDTTLHKMYMSDGTTSSGNWLILN